MNYKSLLAVLGFVVSMTGINGQLIINEVMTRNASSVMDGTTYNFPDWIEVYNNVSTQQRLSLYYLSDDRLDLRKWRMPSTYLQSGDYFIIYCDEEDYKDHANFSLSSDGETFFLSNSSGVIIDSVFIARSYPDISYVRDPNAMENWYFSEIPTPEGRNIISKAYWPSDWVRFSSPAGTYNSGVGISLIGDNVRYTEDGSKPSKTSSLYSAVIQVSNTVNIKATNYRNGYLPSETYCNTYFVNEHKFTLPVVSLSFTPDYFWDKEIGIYVVGVNGIDGNCYGTANWNRPWEREAYLEYFDVDGIKQLSQPIGVKVFGGCSRSFASQKSLSLYARGKYGDGDFDYGFFESKPDIRKFQSVVIRNSGNDFNGQHLRDAFLQNLVGRSIDIDYLEYQPVILYLNAEYYGIINLREKTNEDYFMHNYGIPRDSLDLLQGLVNAPSGEEYALLSGSSDGFMGIIDFISANSFDSQSNYNQVASQLDMQEYINYMATQIYIGNTDWPGNNLKIWRKSNNGKWRWLLYDTDFGFDATSPDHQTIEFAMEEYGPDWPNPPWSTLLFRKFMENEGFRKQFANTILTLRNTVFYPERCNNILDSLSARIDFEMTYHKKKFGGTKDSWYGRLDNLKNFAASRYGFMPGYIESFFGLNSSPVNVTVNNNSVMQGTVWVNNAKIEYYPFAMQTFKELELSFEAKPEKGYRFKHWLQSGQIVENGLIGRGASWKYLQEAVDYPANWKSASFVDASWLEGNAQLGYGDGDESTVLSFGVDENNKIPTYLFRKVFSVDDVTGITGVKLSVLADDAIIVYVNGSEVFRNNIQDGTIGFDTYALRAIGDENAFVDTVIPGDLLLTGNNIIACEVHQVSGTSSDVSFDLSLSYTAELNNGVGIYSTSAKLKSDTSYNIALEPVFEPVDPVEGIVINEISSSYLHYLDEYGEKSGYIEIYNIGSDDLELNGVFVSDQKDNLLRYALPDGTELKANGFLTLYADNDARQGSLHTPFRVGVGGETIYLSQKVGDEITILDSIEYDFLFDNYSYGKYVNGTGQWQFMNNPTPNMPNDPEIPVVNISEIAQNVNFGIYPNPSNGFINIVMENWTSNIHASYYLDILDLSGKVAKPRMRLESDRIDVNLEHLERGVYITRIFKDNQLVYVGKVVLVK